MGFIQKYFSSFPKKPKYRYGDLVPIIFPDLHPGALLNEKQIYNSIRMYIEGRLKIAADSIKLVNETKVPATFFERYDLLMKQLYELSLLENHPELFDEALPSFEIQRISACYIEAQHSMIDRYHTELIYKLTELKTERAKQNRINAWFDNIGNFADRIAPKNKSYIEGLKKIHGR